MKRTKKAKAYHFFSIIRHDNVLTKNQLRSIVSGLVDELEMKPLSRVILKRGTTDPGWTGVIIIEQSHIAFHSFDEQKETWIDILSCKKFSQTKIKRYLTTRIT